MGDFGSGGQGKRNDIANLKDLVKKGASDKEIFEESTTSFLRYYKTIQIARSLFIEKRSWKTETVVLVGPPGCGKTKYVVENGNNTFFKQPSSIWWDGYNGTSDVVLDDFIGWIPFHDLLRITDRYALDVQTKGGQINFAPKRIFITSNKWPKRWYKDDKHEWGALYRRIDKLLYWTVEIDAEGKQQTTMLEVTDPQQIVQVCDSNVF